jgi:ABC-type transport system substrate-binding protein
VVDLLYDTLYQLDGSLQPQPELAASLPEVSEDGLTWTITLAPGVRVFHDGSALSAADVAFSLGLARSPACSLGRAICDAVAATMESVTTVGADQLQLTLREPYAPFLSEVLAQLPILSEDAVRAGTSALLEATAGIPPNEPDSLVTRVTEATTSDSCLVEQPPPGCRLTDHIADLEALLRRVSVPLPSTAAFTDPTGAVDSEGYASELLDRVAALGLVLTSSPTERQAAAVALLDPLDQPLGSGPYRLASYRPMNVIDLEANSGHIGGSPGIPRILMRVMPDPSAAATALLAGDVDWLLQVGTDQRASLEKAAGFRVANRALPMERVIVFNVREGMVFDDHRTRQAFAACLDLAALARDATAGDAILATTPTAAGSWAMAEADPPERDADRARRLLDRAGWREGEDGIRQRGDQRLSVEVAVRPSRADLVAFTTGAATQLRDCGIELLVTDLDLTGDTLLAQLQWPNQFDTVLIARPLAVDPDQDMAAYEGAHATSADNPADANVGGFESQAADALIAAGREVVDPVVRQSRYAELQTVLAEEVPALPIWYEGAWSALGDRVRGRDGGTVDPGEPRFTWDIPEWTLGPIQAAEASP